MRDVVDMECMLGIAQRRLLGDAQYRATLKYIVECTYHRAVDKFHKVVIISRLFEHHKLNMSGPVSLHAVNECLQLTSTQVTRCEHISQTLSRLVPRPSDEQWIIYDTAVARLTPPRENLDWSKLSQRGYVEELTICFAVREMASVGKC